MRTQDIKRHFYYGHKTTHVDRKEAISRLENGEATPITRVVNGVTELIAIRDVEPMKMRDSDPCSITCSEMFTNAMAAVGLAQSKTASMSDSEKEYRAIDDDFIEAAQNKVEMWPFASGGFGKRGAGNRAVTVVPRAAFA